MSDSWNTIFQNCWYVGNNFNCILYGVELVLYFTTVKFVLDRRSRCKRANLNAGASVGEDRKFWVVLSLSTGLLCMITIYLFAQNFFGQEMWIIHEGYTGGSGQYYADHAAVWYQTMGSASSVVMNWMSDAYFIHRVYVVWNGRTRVIVVPCILYAGTVVLGILTCYFSGRPGGNFFVGIAPRIAMAYSAVGIAMNFMCTVLICGRIAYASRGFSNIVNGGTVLDDLNTSGSSSNQIVHKAALMIVESMLPYTLFGAAYVIALGLISPVSILFLSLYVMFTCVSPQMIMLRVVMGHEWRDERTCTADQSSSLKFGGFTKSQVDTGVFRETIALPDLERQADAPGSLYNTHSCS
ncbi:hypothetical protein V8D89_014896 [Ganoderma adspersum]